MAVGVVFEEGEVGLDDDDEDVAGAVLEVVVVVVFLLPSPSLALVSFLVLLLDCIGTTEGLIVCCERSFFLFLSGGAEGDMFRTTLRTTRFKIA